MQSFHLVKPIASEHTFKYWQLNSASYDSHVIRPYWLSLLVTSRNNTESLHKADYHFFLISKHWRVHVLESIEKRRLWIRSYFSSIAS